jgi:hypothetical protein
LTSQNKPFLFPSLQQQKFVKGETVSLSDKSNNKLNIIIVLFVETPRKFITAKLSIRKPGSSSVLIIGDLFNSHALFITE